MTANQKLPHLCYTPQEVVAITRLGKNRVYELLRSGEIPCKRVGHRYLVAASALEEWLRDTNGSA